MTKQTAVEWLIKKLTNRQNGIFDGFPHLSLDEIYIQAKAMEKEQLKKEKILRRQIQDIEAIAQHAVNYVPENMKPSFRVKINHIIEKGGEK